MVVKVRVDTAEVSDHGSRRRQRGLLPATMAPSRGPEPLARSLRQTLSLHKGPVHVVRYAKGAAKYVLSGGQDRSVRLWNPALGTEIKSYSAHGYEVLSITVCVRPDSEC